MPPRPPISICPDDGWPGPRVRCALVRARWPAAWRCAGAAAPSRRTPSRSSRLAMGSELRLTAWTTDEAAARAAFAAVFAEFDRLEALLSVWREGSDVLRLNAAARAGRRCRCTRTRAGCCTRRAGERVDRRQVRRHVRRAGRGLEVRSRPGQPRARSAEESQRALPLRGLPGRSCIDDGPGTAFARRGRAMRVHLGGIGKGYAVDRAVAHPARARAARLHDPGGRRPLRRRARAATRRGGSASTIRAAPAASFATIELRDATFSTSGDYERFFDQGRRALSPHPRSATPASRRAAAAA